MAPFERGSISFRLYPHDLPAGAAIDELVTQACLAVDCGFDGVMISERHGGIVGNVPNNIQMAGWLAREMASGWVAPCPILSFLRPPPLIVEEVAWLAARYPGRVGAGFGTGGNKLDFDIYGADDSDLGNRFGPVLAYIADHLAGRSDDALSRDHAVSLCKTHPVPMLSGAMSGAAARRAAASGVGIIGSSLVELERERRLGEIYRQAGGTGPTVLIRFVWLGEPPMDAINAKFGDYQKSTAAAGRHIAGASEILSTGDPAELVDTLLEAMAVTGHSALHLRAHVPGVPPADVRDQIVELGRTVLPAIRAAWPAASA
jgi:alkanesulfonate monooxygenase SsuD/methylene tetrahydromethanopterin reductase-like flavin-dependent oxidoreductase (luciferase family)